MKLHLSRADGLNQITSYGQGFVAVNGKRHERSLIVTAHSIDPHWPVTDLSSLTHAHVDQLVDAQPEVVLLGTGSRIRFPASAVLRPLIDARIGYEIMDTGAACRTYGVLLAEGRQVLAALIVSGS
jgi:uncharacterized protein